MKYRIEITRENKKDSINIEGNVKIEKYSPLEIGLKLEESLFYIVGDNLSMPVFTDKILKINGNIEQIRKSSKEK